CVAGTCIDPKRCRPEGIECETSSVCCSGRCEKDATESEPTCAEHCFADGKACAKAYDCCSLGCFNGVCGGGICHVNGEACANNAECCSDLCAGGKCAFDTTQSCHAPGDVCTADPDCCYGCDTTKGRCKNDPGQCRALGAPCGPLAPCCKGV